MKKLINQPEDVVRESMAGMAAAHSDLLDIRLKDGRHPAFRVQLSFWFFSIAIPISISIIPTG